MVDRKSCLMRAQSLVLSQLHAHLSHAYITTYGSRLIFCVEAKDGILAQNFKDHRSRLVSQQLSW